MLCAAKGRTTDEPQEPPAPQESANAANAPFDPHATTLALAAAAATAGECKKRGDPGGVGRVTVTFAPNGRVTNAVVGGAFAGTPIGDCVASIFRKIEIPPYSGAGLTVAQNFSIE